VSTQAKDSDTKNTTWNEKEIQDIFKESFEKYFHEVEKAMPQYLESMTKLQAEFLDAWQNTVNKSLEFQNKYAKKININTNIPQDAANIIYTISEEYIKSKNIQNQIVLSTLDSTYNNLKDSKNNFESFMEMNKKLLDFWHGFYIKK